MSSLKDIGERQLIRNIRSFIRKDGTEGTEDDAAVMNDGTVVCSDMVTFERHMPKGMTYEQFGWTAAAVNFSDLAAMGARPTGLITDLALPQDMDEKDLYDMVSGLDQCAEFCGTYIIGGDTKPGPGVIACTALGTMDDRRPMMRSGANMGDIIAVTGSLGGPAAGFHAIENGIRADDAVFSLMVPAPLVEEGIALSSTGKVTSCIDLSDGLATALNTVCSQSGCGANIIWQFLPEGPCVSEICDALDLSKEDLMLNWGGEYGLMFTFAKEDLESIQNSGVEFSMIGQITDDDGAYLINDDVRRKIENGLY